MAAIDIIRAARKVFIRTAVLQNRSLLGLCFLAAVLPASAQTKYILQKIHTGRVVALDPAFDKLVAPGTTLEILATGMLNTEGPLWVADSAMLLFSDTKTRRIYRWKEGHGVSIFLKDIGFTGRLPYSKEPGVNGITIDRNSNLIFANHGDRRVSRYPLSGRYGQETIVDRYNGKLLNSPNDLAIALDGSIWFTDPPYGLPDSSLQEQPVHGIYRMDEAGKTSLQNGEIRFANGLAFSPDGRLLYVASSDSIRPQIFRFSVGNGGKLSNKTLFFDASRLERKTLQEVTDGLVTDQAGNVWASGPGGLLVISPAGKLLGRIEGIEKISNCAWGEGGWIYVTGGSMVYRLRTLTKH